MAKTKVDTIVKKEELNLSLITDLSAVSVLNNKELLMSLANSKLVGKNYTTADVVGAIMLGNEFDISPVLSVQMMDILNTANAPKILKGRSLGLDPIESVESIYRIPGGGTVHTVVGANALMAVLLREKIMFTIIKDYAPIVERIVKSKTFKGEILTPEIEDIIGKANLYQLRPTTTNAVVAALKKANPDIVFYSEEILDYETEILFKREGYPDHISNYKYSQAQASEITTKDNWKDPKIMCQHRAMGRGARFIAADKIGQTYLPGEALDFTEQNMNEMEEPITDVQEVEVLESKVSES